MAKKTKLEFKPIQDALSTEKEVIKQCFVVNGVLMALTTKDNFYKYVETGWEKAAVMSFRAPNER